MYGPNGTGCFRLIIFNSIKMIPITAPKRQAKKKARRTFFVPRTIPNRKNSFMSPAPIPPRLSKMITKIIPDPASAPATDDHHGSRGMMIRNIINAGRKNNNILFGISI